jgi:hypothetical protein
MITMETTGSPKDIVTHRWQRWIIGGLIALTFVIGSLAGQLVGGGFVGAAVQNDATPEPLCVYQDKKANQLGTAVAQATACAEATPMASPIAVEPLMPGTTIQIEDDWEFTVTSISVPAANFKDAPTGRYLQVEVTVKNNAGDGRYFAYGDWILVDDQGRAYELRHESTMDASGGYYRGFGAGSEKTFRIVYDVAPDAGSSFTYVNRADPTIQYALTLQIFG